MNVNLFSWNWNDWAQAPLQDPLPLLGSLIQCADCYAYLDFDLDFALDVLVLAPIEVGMQMYFDAGLNFKPFAPEQTGGFSVGETITLWEDGDLLDIPIVPPFVFLNLGAFVDVDLELSGSGGLAISLPCACADDA